jgi:membrane protease YdiL (CAAX protease family)
MVLGRSAATSDAPPPSSILIAAVVVVGLVQVVLSLFAPMPHGGEPGIPYRFGMVVGSMVVWPAIVIALFSIGRRFRTARTRAIILLIVWGLSCLSLAQRLVVGHRHPLTEAQQRRVLEAANAPRSSSGDTFRLNVPESDPITAGVPMATPAAPAVPAARALAPAAYDFSQGSDKRLIERLEHAQEDEYHRVVEAYAQAFRDQPRNAVLALERVRFIERFAYSEDVTIESAGDDHETAVNDMYARFPDEPSTILYKLGQLWGEAVEPEAGKYLGSVGRWPRQDSAAFHLVRAHAAEATDRPDLARTYARLSFSDDPTVQAGLTYARQAGSAPGDRTRALEMLQHPVFAEADAWARRQQLHLLFDLGANDAALQAYDRLQASSPELVQDSSLARKLAGAGRVEAARAILAASPVQQWNQANELQLRYEFELEHGSAQQALAAYRQLQEASPQADLFMRERFRLFFMDTSLPWSAGDLARAAAFLFALVIALSCPLLGLLPVHYWSLLRQRRGKPGGWPAPLWGLRQAWLLLGSYIAANFVAIWFFAPATLMSWMSDDAFAGETVIAASDLYHSQIVVWIVTSIVLLVLLMRAHAWRLPGRGDWSVWSALGIGCGIAFGLRLMLGLYAVFLPDSALPSGINAAQLAESLFGEILNRHGTLTLLLIVAVIVPVLEELMFRGVVLQALAKHIPFGWANAIQSVAFALVHENLLFAPFYIAMAVASGILARRSGGLLTSIMLHACNNALACIAVIRLHQVAG